MLFGSSPLYMLRLAMIYRTKGAKETKDLAKQLELALGNPSEIKNEFALARISKSPAIYDLDKLNWFNNHYLKEKSLEETFSLAKPGDVIYCDPPYVPLSKSAYFRAYTNKNFSDTDQITLAKLAIESANKGIPVIISNHDTEFTREQYRSASITSFPVKRLISCKASERKSVQELLAIFN